MVGPLPDISADFPITQPFQRRNVAGDDLIRRGRRPRRPGRTEIILPINTDQQVNMIGHDGILYGLHVRIDTIHLQNSALYHTSNVAELRRRGVEDAAPYDPGKDTFPVFRTDGDEIRAILAVKRNIQSIFLSVRVCHRKPLHPSRILHCRHEAVGTSRTPSPTVFIMLPSQPFSFFHSPTASSSQRLFFGLDAWPLTQW